MVDSVVTWATQYKVDGFRFDLMGHHSKANMLAVRAALDALSVEADGVDGSTIYVYGEGWNFGEVADDAAVRPGHAAQHGAAPGIGTFNDRLRDAVRGGGPFDENPRVQGFGSGLLTDPNGDPVSGADEAAQRARLLLNMDQIKVGMAGNLADYSFVNRNGETVTGKEVRLQRRPHRLHRRPAGEHPVRLRPRQRDAVRLPRPQAAPGQRHGGPGADAAAVAVHGGAGPGGVVLPRGDRHAPLQEPGPEQLRLRRLVQHARLLLRVEQLRGRPPSGAGQRGQVGVHAPAAGGPVGEADPGRHRGLGPAFPRPAHGRGLLAAVLPHHRRAGPAEADLPRRQRGPRPHRHAARRHGR